MIRFKGDLERIKGVATDPIRNIDILAISIMACITIALVSGKLPPETYERFMGMLVGILIGDKARG